MCGKVVMPARFWVGLQFFILAGYYLGTTSYESATYYNDWSCPICSVHNISDPVVAANLAQYYVQGCCASDDSTRCVQGPYILWEIDHRSWLMDTMPTVFGSIACVVHAIAVMGLAYVQIDTEDKKKAFRSLVFCIQCAALTPFFVFLSAYAPQINSDTNFFRKCTLGAVNHQANLYGDQLVKLYVNMAITGLGPLSLAMRFFIMIIVALGILFGWPFVRCFGDAPKFVADARAVIDEAIEPVVTAFDMVNHAVDKKLAPRSTSSSSGGVGMTAINVAAPAPPAMTN